VLTSLPPILLVEDDKNDLLLMRHALTDAAVKNTLLVAENGQVAIDLLTKQEQSRTVHVGILFTDINMPISL
jgi:CheY-like chemotaxis protein